MLNTPLKRRARLGKNHRSAEEIFERTKVREMRPGVHQRSPQRGKYFARLDMSYGHARALGWIGTFILGIGYYSIPKLRGGMKPYRVSYPVLAGFIADERCAARLAGQGVLVALAGAVAGVRRIRAHSFLQVFPRCLTTEAPENDKRKLEMWDEV